MQGIHTTFQANFFGALKHSLNFDIEKPVKIKAMIQESYAVKQLVP